MKWMTFDEGNGSPGKCSICHSRQVVQETLDGGWLCKACWKKWMEEPISVIGIEEACESCGRRGNTPRYFQRNGGTRVLCSKCFVEEFGEGPIMVEEIENVRGDVELIPHNPDKFDFGRRSPTKRWRI